MNRLLDNKRIAWQCKIGIPAGVEIPKAADVPMRNAVFRAFKEVTGVDAEACFSGWGATFTQSEMHVIDPAIFPPPTPEPPEEGSAPVPTAEAPKGAGSGEPAEAAPTCDDCGHRCTYVGHGIGWECLGNDKCPSNDPGHSLGKLLRMGSAPKAPKGPAEASEAEQSSVTPVLPMEDVEPSGTASLRGAARLEELRESAVQAAISAIRKADMAEMETGGATTGTLAAVAVEAVFTVLGLGADLPDLGAPPPPSGTADCERHGEFQAADGCQACMEEAQPGELAWEPHARALRDVMEREGIEVVCLGPRWEAKFHDLHDPEGKDSE